jgi:hypothetical protein
MSPHTSIVLQNIKKELLQEGNSEVERRVIFFEELEGSPETLPELKSLVVECLDDVPRNRPYPQQIIDRLESMTTDNAVGSPNPGDVQRAANILKKAEEKRINEVGHVIIPCVVQ